MGSLKVVLSSGWVTLASLKRRPMGRMNLSCFGGLRVKLSPTKVILLILRFQHFLFLFPERMTSNISASLIGLTFSTGTDHLPAFSFLFCLTMLVRTLELRCCSRSMRKVGTAPSSMSSALLLAFFSSCCLMVFFICIFSLNRSLLKSLALMPFRDWAFFEITLVFLAYFFLLFSSASSLSPKRFLCSYMQSFCGIPDVEKLQSHYPQTFINTKTEPGSEKSEQQKINRHLLQVQPLTILHQDLQSICLDLLLLGADGQLLPLLCRVLLHHAEIEGLDFVEKR